MNDDKIKGVFQKIGGHIEEAAGALVGDENLKVAGKEDQLKGGGARGVGQRQRCGGQSGRPGEGCEV